MKLSDLNFNDHVNCCRICMKKLSASSKTAGITKVIENKFKAVTSMELRLTPEFSRTICLPCDRELTKSFKYVTRVKRIQQKLYNIIDKNIKKEVSIKCEVNPLPSDDDNDSLPLFNPIDFLKIKTANDRKLERAERKLKRKLEEPQKPPSEDEHEEPPTPLFNSSDFLTLDESSRAVKRGSEEPLDPPNAKRTKNSLKPRIGQKSYHCKIKRYFCDICGYGTPRKPIIAQHVSTHLSEEARRIHACQFCDFVSVSRKSLKVHVELAHIATKNHICHCGAEFTLKQSLTSHQRRVHEKIRPHNCEECGEGFYTKKEMNHHIKTKHQPDIKNFSCDICGAQFCTRRQFQSHQQIHIKKFKCTFDGCDRAFSTPGDFKAHLNTHTGNRTEVCHLCQKSYFTKSHLRIHLDVVHKMTTYYCIFCDFTNSRRDYLGNHLKNHHNLESEEVKEALKRAKVVKKNI